LSALAAPETDPRREKNRLPDPLNDSRRELFRGP
jgi:hypothetical protein